MKKLAFTFLLTFLGVFSFAQITGKWKTIDDKTGAAKSIVEITESQGVYSGKVVEILNPARKHATCEKCAGADKGKKVLGLKIINGLKWDKDKQELTGGTILDPESGKVYKCLIKRKGPNTIEVRGYLGISLIGRSQTWHAN